MTRRAGKKYRELQAFLAGFDGAFSYGTAPEWDTETGAFEKCRVVLATGGKAIAIEIPMARRWAEELRTKVPSIATSLDQMIEIAARYEAQRPSFTEEMAAQLSPKH